MAEGKKHKLVGSIVSIKLKSTEKGDSASYMCVTEKGNKFWFMGWKSPWFRDNGAVDLSDFCEGQELTIEGTTRNAESIKTNDDGTKIMFLGPNPKLIRATPQTVEQRTQRDYRHRLAALNNERLAGAIQALVSMCDDRIESSDDEFVRSLAEGAAKYESVTDKQREHVIRLCAKYITKSAEWRTAVDESLASGATMAGAGGAGPAGQGEGSYGDEHEYDIEDDNF
jgi:hypothetical protein